MDGIILTLSPSTSSSAVRVHPRGRREACASPCNAGRRNHRGMPAVPAGNRAPSPDPSTRIGAPSLSRVPVLEAEESRYYDNLTKIAIIVHL